MKRLLTGFIMLACTGWAWGGQGTSTTLTVSSGTFLKIQGYANNSGGFVQSVGVSDSSFTVTAPVDAITGLTVNLASSSLTTQNALQVYQVNPETSTITGSVGAVITNWVSTVTATQAGSYTVTQGTGNFVMSVTTVTFNGSAQPVTQSGAWGVGINNWVSTVTAIQANSYTVTMGTGNFVLSVTTVSQSGTWTVSPGTGTYPVEFLTPQIVLQSSSGVNASTIAVSQQGTWTVNPGTGTYNVNIVGGGGSGGTSSNFTSAFPSAGTAAGGMGVNGLMMPFAVDSSSNIKVNVVAGGAAGGTSSNFGAAFPAAGTAIGGVNGSGNMQSFVVDSSSFLKVNVAAGGAGGGAAQYLNTSNALTTPSYVGVVSSFPVNVINTSFGATQSGTWGVLVTNTISTASVSVNNWVSTVSAIQANSYTVTMGTGNFVLSVTTVSQSGTWTVSPGTGTYQIFGSVANSTIAVVGTLGDNGISAGTNRLPVLPGVYQATYAGGTANTAGRNAANLVGTDGLLWTASLPTSRPASFAVSTAPVGGVAASATDIACIRGNATNDVYLYGIRASCTQTTAGIIDIEIDKYSTFDVGAWSTMTVVAQDSTMNVAISSAVVFYSNPTVGTLVGHLDDAKIGCMATGTTTPNDIYISPSDWKMKPIILRGIAQSACINLEGATVTGGKFAFAFDWFETPDIAP